MSKPLISINICMYNSSRYIDETLRTVFAQTFQDFEIVIVDDGSTDGSAEFVERHYPDPRVTVVRQRHQTLRIARPVALAHSKGEYIAFLDSDDLWHPMKLERQVAVARTSPNAGLIFCDCEIIDVSGHRIGNFAEQFDLRSLDLCGIRGHLELLRRGNFLASPTPFALAAALRAVGGFNRSYQYVNDYDMWLRVARRYTLKYIDESLAKYRIHETQFTQRNPHITLPEQCALLRPIFRSSSYPPTVRVAIGDNLLGQHRLGWRLLLKQRRFGPAARAALDIWKYPDRIRDSLRHRLSTTPVGRFVEAGIVAYLWSRNAVARAMAQARRIPRAPRRLLRSLRSQGARIAPREPDSSPTEIWIDGSALGRTQAGYSSFLCELIRHLACQQSPPLCVHVGAQAAGRAALIARLGSDASAVRFHPIGWRAVHWSRIHQLLICWQAQLLVVVLWAGLALLGMATGNVLVIGSVGVLVAAQIALLVDELGASVAEEWGRPRQRLSARLVRFAWRRLPAPRGRAPAGNTVEVLVWRGRFRWSTSRRIAIVQDMTTRIHPELHTASNVAEFDEFLGYVQRHAHEIATVSEHSRRDIVDRIAVCPDSVTVIPMPVHPQYVNPNVSRGFVRYHGICQRYILCVGTIEPRKNLRRLVKAFELVKDEPAARNVTLVLAGPPGWDAGFPEFLTGTDASPRVRMLGFVPLEHLPSLYHFASAVIYPSVYEGFGLPVLEAMCSSGVLLASRASSLPEVLGGDGLLFDPYSVEDIAEALRRALTLSPADETSYRKRCRRRADLHLERLRRQSPLPGLGIEGMHAKA